MLCFPDNTSAGAVDTTDVVHPNWSAIANVSRLGMRSRHRNADRVQFDGLRVSRQLDDSAQLPVGASSRNNPDIAHVRHDNWSMWIDNAAEQGRPSSLPA